MWVMPSSSARCAQLPRAADKVPFYAALKKFRDYLNGVITEIDESEMVFTEPRVKSCYEAEPKPDIYSTELTDISNAVIKKDDGTIVPCKKKRGRPKKIKIDGEEPPPKPIIRKPPPSTQHNCDFPKKKRGRPKKVKVDNIDGIPSQQQSVPSDNNNTSTNMSQCYSNPSPIQSPSMSSNNNNNNNNNNNSTNNNSNNFYQMGPAITPPNSNSATSNLYGPRHQPPPQQVYSHHHSPRPPYSQSPRPPPYTTSQSSPRPHSQPFTHSDLSSEISAAISSEQLGSPASPSLGPPDFDPPTSMAEEAECRLSPTPSTNSSEQTHYQTHYTHYNMDPEYVSTRQPQDIASKSLSGLESLVDQIPSITEGETSMTEAPDQYSGHQYQYNGRITSTSSSPVPPYNYPTPSSGYPPPLYPPSWSTHYEPPMPPLAYPQLQYAQSYGPGLHMPSPNYPPYYSYPHPQPAAPHPHGYPPYLGGF